MTDIRPFRVAVPDDDLRDLQDRLARTRWAPEGAAGVSTARLQELVEHCGPAATVDTCPPTSTTPRPRVLAVWHRRDPLEHFVDGDRARVENWPRV